ncbi:hypothetical protein, conserved [Cyanidioschyzon merolae strain 10D]|uniref:VTT domain-containing protein n=1 Tax=Cyanidioschyzon merolae (strain NIES-3377 / 10D) TaxID=280699 RepID=M1V6Q5_CYAM1|nr:hypothetical protein, conserved [Cyanidioschyzon merolae strain 10D]BAM79139.1 hypothetical protein, conserved [Cyanidioschyzon merolae strain 10D]|eukprot:XP_005535425.1 hypothetical protein, conserved [Cyanidioschyzon merolae strain 10D]
MAFQVFIGSGRRSTSRLGLCRTVVKSRPRSSVCAIKRAARTPRACAWVTNEASVTAPGTKGVQSIESETVQNKNTRIKWFLGAGVLFCVVVVFYQLGHQPWVHARFSSLVQRLVTLADQHGPGKIAAAFALLHFVAIVLCFPASALIEVAAGYTLGFPLGFLSMHLSKLGAAIACFILGRTVLYGYVQKQCQRFPRFRYWLDIVRREGPSMMLYMRLSPVPSFINNYLLAAVGVRFSDFLWTTTLGIVPGLLPLVGAGVGARDLSLLSMGADGALPKAATVPSWAHTLRLGSTIVGAVLLVGFLVRLYRQRIEARSQVLAKEPVGEDSADRGPR